MVMMGGFRAIPTSICSVLLLGLLSLPLLAQAAGDPWEEAAEESFWYSLYNVESLLLYSGMGPAYPTQALEESVPSLPEDWLKRIFPIRAPYRSGMPHFIQPPDPQDPATLRWSALEMERTISLEALAYTVIAAGEWSKRLEQFAASQSDSKHFAHLQARLFSELASAMIGFAEEKLRRPDGLYLDELRWWRETPLTQGPPPWRGQLAWLWALASGPLELAEEHFRNLSEQLPWEELSIRDASLAVKALAWLAALDPALRAEAVRRLDGLAARLMEQSDASTLSSQAAIVSGLLYAYHLTGDGRYRTAALKSWDSLRSLWDEWQAKPLEITIEDVGELLSAFHTMIYVAGDDEAKLLYAELLDTLKRAGLQRSEWPESGGGYDGDPVPDPREAGEAPVFIGAVGFDGEGWRVKDGRFRTAPAIYAANTLLWLSVFQGEAFAGPPEYGLPEAEAVRRLSLPRRVEAISEALAQIQLKLERLNKEVEALKLEAAWEERARGLERGLSSLRNEIDRKLNEHARDALTRLDALKIGIDQVRQEIRNLAARVHALEQGPPAKAWLVRPEILLIAVLLVGIALTAVGIIRLRMKA